MLHGRKEMGGGSERSGSSPVGGVVATPECTRAGNPGADSIGQRGRREYPRAGGTAQGYPTNGVSVAATVCQSWLGRSAQPAARWASTADHLDTGTSSSERHPAQ